VVLWADLSDPARSKGYFLLQRVIRIFSQPSSVRSIAFELRDTSRRGHESGGGQTETNGAFFVAQESAMELYA
jgi:hypothetical protein